VAESVALAPRTHFDNLPAFGFEILREGSRAILVQCVVSVRNRVCSAPRLDNPCSITSYVFGHVAFLSAGIPGCFTRGSGQLPENMQMNSPSSNPHAKPIQNI
jgi:hypothetical protein